MEGIWGCGYLWKGIRLDEVMDGTPVTALVCKEGKRAMICTLVQSVQLLGAVLQRASSNVALCS